MKNKMKKYNASICLIIFFACLLNSSLVAQEKVYREKTEWSDFWMPNATDEKLPHVLLIGNSITNRYHGEVEKQLNGLAYCAKYVTSKSLGDPLYLKEIELVLQQKKFDVIHFNNGMHGFDYSEQQYKAAFPQIIALFHTYASKAKIVWATTTPVREKDDIQKIALLNKRVIKRNQAVKEFLRKENIIENDLYILLINQPTYYTKGDGVHPNQKGINVLANKVVEVLSDVLREKSR